MQIEFQHQQGVNRREGIGLLEPQAMPSLLDVDRDGVLCKFSGRSAPDQGKRCGW
jgi:hypothetical protein